VVGRTTFFGGGFCGSFFGFSSESFFGFFSFFFVTLVHWFVDDMAWVGDRRWLLSDIRQIFTGRLSRWQVFEYSSESFEVSLQSTFCKARNKFQFSMKKF
jgi:hypothetical protein